MDAVFANDFIVALTSHLYPSYFRFVSSRL
jgi:hypothetical protein